MYFKYSIIIPHHNLPHLLYRLLKTIPFRSDVQVIVVDDCSSFGIDHLEELKKEFNQVEWYSTQYNGGGGKARNIGLEYALGDYIIFADADDYFLEDCINIWDKYVALYKNVDILYFPVESRDSTTGKTSWRHLNKVNDIKSLKSDYDIDLYLRYCYTEPWGKLIRRDLVRKYNITFQESCVANDFLFSVRTGYYAESIQYCKDSLFYIYSVRDDSISIDQLESDEKVLTRLNVYYDVEEFAKKNNFGIYPFSRFFIALFLKHKVKRNVLRRFCHTHNKEISKILLISAFKTLRFTLYHKILNKIALRNY